MSKNNIYSSNWRIIKLLLLFSACAFVAFPGLSTGLVCDHNDDFEKSKAALTDYVKKNVSEIPEADSKTGRSSFLRWMKKEPDALTKDLDRAQLSSFKFGSSSIFERAKSWFSNLTGKPAEKGVKLSACEKFNKLSRDLKTYLKKFSKVTIGEETDTIGKFHTAEILYAIDQTFVAPPDEMPQKFDEKGITMATIQTWIEPLGEKANEKRLYSFVFAPKTGTLTATIDIQTTLIHKEDKEKPSPRQKLYAKVGQVMFNLGSGDVSFSFKHSLTGMKPEKWSGIIAPPEESP